MLTSMKALVDTGKGFMDRGIYVDEDIYQQELEQVFGRSWLFVAHESQIAKPNDFMANYMGEDPVLVCRDSKGRIHTFLNMCRHRGNRICRADFGNAPSFMCTYHGWTFATDGRLVGVPGFKEAYFEELDRSQWGLVEVAQLDTYKGLVFATWDKSTPALLNYLGDMAWYMDCNLDRAGGTEMLGGVHRWMQPMNWKMSMDNQIGDSYHIATTHAITGGSRGFTGGGWSISAGNGHGMPTVGTSRGDDRYGSSKAAREHAMKIGEVLKNPAKFYAETPKEEWPPLGTDPPELAAYFQQTVPEARKRLGDTRANVSMSGPYTVFPNFEHTGPSLFGYVRVLHPRGPMKTEEWTWLLVDKEAPQEIKDLMRRSQTVLRGPSGIHEENDAGNFMQCTQTAKSNVARRYPVNLQLGLGRERKLEEFPGTAAPSPSEVAQRGFYARWAEIMDASSWDQVKMDPITYHRV